MKADNEFLAAMANKLQEIADNSVDVDTQSELFDLVDVIVNSMSL